MLHTGNEHGDPAFYFIFVISLICFNGERSFNRNLSNYIIYQIILLRNHLNTMQLALIKKIYQKIVALFKLKELMVVTHKNINEMHCNLSTHHKVFLLLSPRSRVDFFDLKYR